MFKNKGIPRQTLTIELALTCPHRRCEVMLDDLTSTACLVEETCGLVLTCLFETVIIDQVDVQLNLGSGPPITISLRARGYEPLQATFSLDLSIEEHLTSALSEFFEALQVDRCAVN